MNEEEQYDIKNGKPLETNLDGGSKIDLYTSSVDFDDPSREDKKVIVTTSDGKSKQTSHILLGYNKDANGNPIIQLQDTTYVSSEDIINALLEAFAKVSNDEVVVAKSTGKKVTAEDLQVIISLCGKLGKITLDESKKITNQVAKAVQVTGKDATTAKRSGTMMLGNDGYQLPNGEYVSLSEIETAVKDFYVVKKKDGIVIPPIGPIGPIGPKDKGPIPPIIPVGPFSPNGKDPIPPVMPTEEEKDEVNHIDDEKKEEKKSEKVIKRIKLRIIPIISAIYLFLLGLGIHNDDKSIDIPTLVASIIELQDEKGLTTEEALKEVYAGLKIGDTISVPEGTKVHESSDYEYGGANKIGTIGNEVIPAGEYNIEYISIINPADGSIVKVAVEPGVSFKDTLDEAAAKLGVDYKDLEGKIHINNPIAGWIDVDLSVVGQEVTELENASKYVVDGQKYAVSEKGDAVYDEQIAIDTDKGPVTFALSDYTKDGDIIVGSDGEEYRIEGIVKASEATTVESGKSVTWSFTNMKNNIKHMSKLPDTLKEALNILVDNIKTDINQKGGM